MPDVLEGHVRPIDPRRLEPLIGSERLDALMEAATTLRALLGDRQIVNVNSTATGGGVAEMLAALLGYVRGIGLKARWSVINGDPHFFFVTKRIHNGLYGSPGDGGKLGHGEREIYERTIARNLARINAEVREGDVVIVHDPQPAGLITPLVELGAHVIWRCHVGYEGENEWTERSWAFVGPSPGGPRTRLLARVVRASLDRSRVTTCYTAFNRSVHRKESRAQA